MKTEIEGLNSKPKKLSVSSPFDNKNQIDEFSPNYAKQSFNETNSSKVPSEYVSIKDIISSKLFFTPLEDIHIRPFNAEEVILVNYAHESESYRPLAQAINSTIFEDFNCLDLTYSDVKQIMCWLRLNSFIKSKWKMKVVCTNTEHENRILDESVPEDQRPNIDSLVNEITILDTDFIINYIDENKSAKAFDAMQNDYSLTCVPMTFRMYIELEELLDEIATKDENGSYDINSITPENRNNLFIANYAKYLAPCHGDTLKEKIDFFKILKLPADIYSDLLEFSTSTEHNITEQVVSTCKECGGEIITNLVITPRHFFP